MYRDSINLYGRLFKFVLAFVVFEIVIQIISERAPNNTWTGVISVFNWAALAFVAHLSILFPDRKEISYSYNRLLVGFAIRTLGLGVIGIAPALIIIFVVLFRFSGSMDEETLLGLVVGISMMGMLLLALVVFPLFGTMLPAYVMQDKTQGLGIAFARGRKTFTFAASRMLAGPVPVYAVSIALTLTNVELLTGNLLSDSFVPNVVGILFLVVLYLIQALSAIMTAWVLSHAYMRLQSNWPASVFD